MKKKRKSEHKDRGVEIFGWALLSRLIIIVWSFISPHVVGSYDSSARLQGSKGALGANWDAAYFGRIASHGYELEQFHAFFPLMPALVRGMTYLLETLFWNDSDNFHPEDWVGMVGVCVSVTTFLAASQVLYRLGRSSSFDEEVAFRAAILFCFNPASIFMTAFYTESLYALCSMAGMLAVSPTRTKSAGPSFTQLVHGAVWFALATLTRSNGGTLAGYLGFSMLLPLLEGRHLVSARNVCLIGLKLVFPLILSSLVPLGAVLAYGYWRYCNVAESRREWCEDSVPNIYQFVQKEYWNVGFFRYYELKQVPNFLLALPMAFWAGATLRWGGRRQELVLIPHLLHLAFLLFVGLTIVHVQVLTRFLASCPVLYWYLASESQQNNSLVVSWAIMYMSVFFLLGAAMFSCYFPWT